MSNYRRSTSQGRRMGSAQPPPTSTPTLSQWNVMRQKQRLRQAQESQTTRAPPSQTPNTHQYSTSGATANGVYTPRAQPPLAQQKQQQQQQPLTYYAPVKPAPQRRTSPGGTATGRADSAPLLPPVPPNHYLSQRGATSSLVRGRTQSPSPSRVSAVDHMRDKVSRSSRFAGGGVSTTMNHSNNCGNTSINNLGYTSTTLNSTLNSSRVAQPRRMEGTVDIPATGNVPSSRYASQRDAGRVVVEHLEPAASVYPPNGGGAAHPTSAGKRVAFTEPQQQQQQQLLPQMHTSSIAPEPLTKPSPRLLPPPSAVISGQSPRGGSSPSSHGSRSPSASRPVDERERQIYPTAAATLQAKRQQRQQQPPQQPHAAALATGAVVAFRAKPRGSPATPVRAVEPAPQQQQQQQPPPQRRPRVPTTDASVLEHYDGLPIDSMPYAPRGQLHLRRFARLKARTANPDVSEQRLLLQQQRLQRPSGPPEPLGYIAATPQTDGPYTRTDQQLTPYNSNVAPRGPPPHQHQQQQQQQQQSPYTYPTPAPPRETAQPPRRRALPPARPPAAAAAYGADHSMQSAGATDRGNTSMQLNRSAAEVVVPPSGSPYAVPPTGNVSPRTGLPVKRPPPQQRRYVSNQGAPSTEARPRPQQQQQEQQQQQQQPNRDRPEPESLLRSLVAKARLQQQQQQGTDAQPTQPGGPAQQQQQATPLRQRRADVSLDEDAGSQPSTVKQTPHEQSNVSNYYRQYRATPLREQAPQLVVPAPPVESAEPLAPAPALAPPPPPPAAPAAPAVPTASQPETAPQTSEQQTPAAPPQQPAAATQQPQQTQDPAPVQPIPPPETQAPAVASPQAQPPEPPTTEAAAVPESTPGKRKELLSQQRDQHRRLDWEQIAPFFPGLEIAGKSDDELIAEIEKQVQVDETDEGAALEKERAAHRAEQAKLRAQQAIEQEQFRKEQEERERQLKAQEEAKRLQWEREQREKDDVLKRQWEQQHEERQRKAAVEGARASVDKGLQQDHEQQPHATEQQQQQQQQPTPHPNDGPAASPSHDEDEDTDTDHKYFSRTTPLPVAQVTTVGSRNLENGDDGTSQSRTPGEQVLYAGEVMQRSAPPSEQQQPLSPPVDAVPVSAAEVVSENVEVQPPAEAAGSNNDSGMPVDEDDTGLPPPATETTVVEPPREDSQQPTEDAGKEAAEGVTVSPASAEPPQPPQPPQQLRPFSAQAMSRYSEGTDDAVQQLSKEPGQPVEPQPTSHEVSQRIEEDDDDLKEEQLSTVQRMVNSLQLYSALPLANVQTCMQYIELEDRYVRVNEETGEEIEDVLHVVERNMYDRLLGLRCYAPKGLGLGVLPMLRYPDPVSVLSQVRAAAVANGVVTQQEVDTITLDSVALPPALLEFPLSRKGFLHICAAAWLCRFDKGKMSQLVEEAGWKLHDKNDTPLPSVVPPPPRDPRLPPPAASTSADAAGSGAAAAPAAPAAATDTVDWDALLHDYALPDFDEGTDLMKRLDELFAWCVRNWVEQEVQRSAAAAGLCSPDALLQSPSMDGPPTNEIVGGPSSTFMPGSDSDTGRTSRQQNVPSRPLAFARCCQRLTDVYNLRCWPGSFVRSAPPDGFADHVTNLLLLCTVPSELAERQRLLRAAHGGVSLGDSLFTTTASADGQDGRPPVAPAGDAEMDSAVVGGKGGSDVAAAIVPSSPDQPGRSKWTLFMGAPQWSCENVYGGVNALNSSAKQLRMSASGTPLAAATAPANLSGRPMPQPAARVAYSFLSRARAYNLTGGLGALFFSILIQQLPEAAFFDSMLMMEKLKLSLQYCEAGGEEAEGIEGDQLGTPQQTQTSQQQFSRAASGGGTQSEYGRDNVVVVPVKPTLASVGSQLFIFFPHKNLRAMRILCTALVEDLVASGSLVIPDEQEDGEGRDNAGQEVDGDVANASPAHLTAELIIGGLVEDLMERGKAEDGHRGVVRGADAALAPTSSGSMAHDEEFLATLTDTALEQLNEEEAWDGAMDVVGQLSTYETYRRNLQILDDETIDKFASILDTLLATRVSVTELFQYAEQQQLQQQQQQEMVEYGGGGGTGAPAGTLLYGHKSKLVEVARLQYIEELLQSSMRLQEAILSAPEIDPVNVSIAHGTAAAGEEDAAAIEEEMTRASVRTLLAALCEADPTKPVEDVTEYLKHLLMLYCESQPLEDDVAAITGVPYAVDDDTLYEDSYRRPSPRQEMLARERRVEAALRRVFDSLSEPAGVGALSINSTDNMHHDKNPTSVPICDALRISAPELAAMCPRVLSRPMGWRYPTGPYHPPASVYPDPTDNTAVFTSNHGNEVGQDQEVNPADVAASPEEPQDGQQVQQPQQPDEPKEQLSAPEQQRGQAWLQPAHHHSQHQQSKAENSRSTRTDVHIEDDDETVAYKEL